MQRGVTEAARLEAAVQRLATEAQHWQEADWYRAREAGEWTAMETLAHMVELVTFWSGELRRIVATPGTHFGRTIDDRARMAWVEQHRQDRPEQGLSQLREAAEKSAALLRSFAAEDWTKTGIDARGAETEVQEIVERRILAHVEEHVAQVTRAARPSSEG